MKAFLVSGQLPTVTPPDPIKMHEVNEDPVKALHQAAEAYAVIVAMADRFAAAGWKVGVYEASHLPWIEVSAPEGISAAQAEKDGRRLAGPWADVFYEFSADDTADA